MPILSYLQKSRHGVYYFRAVIPISVRRNLNLKAREVRVSLKTKDLRMAKQLLAHRLFVMSKKYSNDHPQPWEVAADERLARYQRGMYLLGQYGIVDMDDEFAREAVLEELSSDDLKAYLFALEHQLNKKNPKNATATQNASLISPVQPAALVELNSSPNRRDELSDATLIEAIDRYILSIGGTIKQGTISKYRSQCLVFLNIISNGKNDLAVSQIGVQHMQLYVDRLPRLPRKTLPNQAYETSGLEQGSQEGMSAKTIFHHAAATKALLDWLESQKYELTHGLSTILKPLLRKPKKLKNKVLRYQKDQIKTLFESRSYAQGSFKRPSDYWVPLIGLYSGAREGEICQLKTEDIKYWSDGGFWYMDIHDQDGNTLKTEASVRQVPLHPHLIELGLIEYRAWLLNRSVARLFEDEERNKYDSFSAFSKRFNRYRMMLGVRGGPGQKLDFHSFRHTLTAALMGEGHEEYAINDITGHSNNARSIAFLHYGARVAMAKKFEMIRSLDFGINLSVVRKNGFEGWGSP